MLSPLRDIMNNEVTRLRQLRKTALKVRALALVLNNGKSDNGVYVRAAVLQWRIARIATGRLRSHPYTSYQKDQGYFESLADRLDAYMLGSLALVRGQGMRTFAQAVSMASRALDDARALTLSTDLSDALGRAQLDMKVLIEDIRALSPHEAGQYIADRNPQSPTHMPVSRVPTSPYLAL